MNTDYFSAIVPIIEKIQATQGPVIDEAGKLLGEVIAGGRLVHLFGSGHSVIPVLDIFPRYGSFAGFHPLMDSRLMWSNVLGPGGVKELLWLERREGYARVILESQPVAAGDAIVVYSHGGMNAAPVEIARECRERGLKVIAVTCAANRPKLAEHADLVIPRIHWCRLKAGRTRCRRVPPLRSSSSRWPWSRKWRGSYRAAV